MSKNYSKIKKKYHEKNVTIFNPLCLHGGLFVSVVKKKQSD